MRKLLFLLTVVLSIAAVTRQAAHAQTLKIGYVNSSKILQEYPEAQEANKKLDAMARAAQAELERMSKELQQKYEDYKKKETILNN